MKDRQESREIVPRNRIAGTVSFGRRLPGAEAFLARARGRSIFVVRRRLILRGASSFLVQGRRGESTAPSMQGERRRKRRRASRRPGGRREQRRRRSLRRWRSSTA